MYENIDFEVDIYLDAKWLLFTKEVNVDAEVFEAIENQAEYYEKVENGLMEQNIAVNNLTSKISNAILDEKYMHIFEDEIYFNLKQTSNAIEGTIVYSVPVAFDVYLFMKDIKEL